MWRFRRLWRRTASPVLSSSPESLAVFQDGEVLARLTGNNDEDDYADKIEALL